jgi:alkylation response protein AidB-like acyl-CoA dehydrogenase
MRTLIRTDAAKADHDRRLSPAVVAALVEAGATRMLAPASLGGGEVDLPSWVVAIEDLARADGSAGWTAMTPDGPRLMLFPSSDVTVHDTWHAAGLRATESHEWEASGAFVPARGQVWPPAVRVSGPLPVFPFFAFLAVGVAAVGLGIAARAIEEVEALAATKTPQHAQGLLAEQAEAQRDLGVAEARLSAARAFPHAEVADRWAAAVAGQASTIQERARLRLACSHAATESASITRQAFDIGGGTSVFENSPLQRCLRNAHVAAQHAIVSRRLFETYGKVKLGIPTDTTRL